ncbi:MAG: hypothetical protein ABIF17_01300 [Patescibacteria group bacterium]
MNENFTNRIENLKSKSLELDRSSFFRNKVTYEKFAQLIENDKKISALIIGLANLEEPLVCLATYYHNKGSFGGLDLELYDIREKNEFVQLLDQEDTFSLGNDIFTKKPRQPLDYSKNAFTQNESNQYTFNQEIRDKLNEVIETKSNFEISIENQNELDNIGFSNKKYIFISCNNVLQYIDKKNLSNTIDRLLNQVALDGIISLRTDALDDKIRLYIKENRKDFEKISKGVYKKIS